MFVKKHIGHNLCGSCQKLKAVIVCKINSDSQMWERHGN